MLSSVEAADNSFCEKFSHTHEALILLRDAAAAIRTKASGRKALTIDSLQINLLLDELESIRFNYGITVVSTLTEYYTNPSAAAATTTDYYGLITRENFNATCNNIITKARVIAGVLGKLGADLGLAPKNLSIAASINIFAPLEKREYEQCSCGERMIIVPELSELHCPNEDCAKIRQIVGAVFRDDQFYPQNGQRTKQNGYDTSRHYKFWIERIQAREHMTFDPADIQKIEYVIKRDGYERSQLTCENMRHILKDPKVGATRLNDHVPLLVVMFGGRSPPQLSFKENRQLAINFNKMMHLYDRVNTEGGNKPYYPQFILQAIKHTFRDNPEKLRLIEYIHLQSRDTVIKNDKAFELMCEIADPEDGFVYTPTDPSGCL